MSTGTKSADFLRGKIILAPMTKGSNLPFRRLCQDLGAEVTMSEMAVARNVVRGKRSEMALLRRFPEEKIFGVQLCGRRPDELGAAAKVAEQHGADFVDLNLGCPIDQFTGKGLGAALMQSPGRVARLVRALNEAVEIPVTVKIRSGWDETHINAVKVAVRAVEAGASAVHVHGRTRKARYTQAADWSLIGEVQRALDVPVIGNGDILTRADAEERLEISGASALMVARGALIKPWLGDEIRGRSDGDLGVEERILIYRRLAAGMLAHFGDDEIGRRRARLFLRWHCGFFVRHISPGITAERVALQHRVEQLEPRSALEAFLLRQDDPALDFFTDCLLDDLPLDPGAAPGIPAVVERDDRDDRDLRVEG